MGNLKLLRFYILFIFFGTIYGCRNPWDIEESELNDQNFLSSTLCAVATMSGQACKFPFTHNGVTYNRCMLDSRHLPQCRTQTGAWSQCLVPTDALIEQVTTKLYGDYRTNGASYEGGTLIYIKGKRFAPEELSTSETAATSNRVILTNDLSSYECDIHRDMTSSTQIACYSRKMQQGYYLIQVFVKGNLIPFYQYLNKNRARIRVHSSNTPYIRSISPNSGLPGSFVDITGDFKTVCYSRDRRTCGNEYDTRISRIYFGSQQCQLMDPSTGETYENVTRVYMKCKLDKPEINFFLANMLVSNNYGRAVIDKKTVYVAPDETIYNFATYAEIDEVSPQNGSVNGGTLITITGKYLYTDSFVPADVRIGGRSCEITDFNRDDQTKTRIECRTMPAESADSTPMEYYGNRGITLFKFNGYSSDLASVVRPSMPKMTLDEMYYSSSSASTIWLIGYILPGKTSFYQLSVSTNANARLYVSSNVDSANKTIVASNGSPGTLKLEANKEYYLELIASRNGGFTVQVNAKLLETTVTEDISSSAYNQHSEVEITSDALPEEYRVLYEDFDHTNGTEEIQCVTVEYSPDTYFMLQLNGLNTALISSNASALEVESALNDMPYLQPNMVYVNESFIKRDNETVAKNFTITFDADLGDVYELVVIGNVSANVDEVQTGVPTGNKYQVTIDGMRSGRFDLRDSAMSIKSALTETFKVRCPMSINKKDNNVFFLNDFENGCSTNNPNMTAFCGKCSMKGSSYLFSNLNSSMEYNNVCFAYKSPLNLTRMAFRAVDPYGILSDEYSFGIQTMGDDKWHYMCADLYEAYKHLSHDLSSPQKMVLLNYIKIYNVNSETRFDVISVRKNIPQAHDHSSLVDSRRLFPTFQYTSFEVSKSNSGEIHTISIKYRTSECLTGLYPMQFAGDPGNAIISKVSSASPRVTGTFDLEWDGQTLPRIEASITEADMILLLESLENLGTVTVARSKDCHGYKWSIKWKNGGKKAIFTLPSHNLVGDNVAISARVIKTGGVDFNPIPGTMLRTYDTMAQVTVSVAGVLTKCVGSCSFEWMDSLTPTVDTIDTISLSRIVITGSGFSSDPLKNDVKIGSVPCEISSASENEIICSAGMNSIGTYGFEVNVLDKGLATMNSNATVTFHLKATEFSPKSGLTGGGTLLNVTGTGFSSQSIVAVDGNVCHVIEANYSLIRCTLPSNPTNINKMVDVTVTEMAEISTVPAQFLYDYNLTPIVTAINPYLISVSGGAIVNISGINLPIWPNTVRIGSENVQVIFSNTSAMVIRAPAMRPGLYDLFIENNASGNAYSDIKIEYQLYISSITPKIGSSQGGTVVTIYGEGFSETCSKNQVNFDLSRCRVINCTSNWIQCETLSSHITHEVNNDATDPYYGKGYAWSKPHLAIEAGESVHWSWKTPVGVTGVKFQVLQAENSVRKNLDYGFSSGEASPMGSFTYQFNVPGTYYYWSGYVESTLQITFRGVIVVTSSANSKELEVDVTVDGHQAQKCSFPFTYNGVEYTECTNIDSSYRWCLPQNSTQKLRCDPIDIAPVIACKDQTLEASTCGVSIPTSNFKLVFTKCSGNLPQVQSVSKMNVTFDEIISISGSGFSTKECENEVVIGGVQCPLIFSSTTQLDCILGAGKGLKTNTPHFIQVKIKNYGFAQKESEFEIKFVPKIISINPLMGSKAGGTNLTLIGDGFEANNTLIIIGNSAYFQGEGADITERSINIITNAAGAATHEIQVFVNNVRALCANCDYKYSSRSTPDLSDVHPMTVNGSTLITLNGSFDETDPSKFTVRIGRQYCIVETADSTTLTCRLEGLEMGTNQVSLSIQGKGDALHNAEIQVSGLPTLMSLSPVSGSVYGGTVVTINGNGFDETTVVSFGTYLCKVISIWTTSLTCETSQAMHISSEKQSEIISITVRTSGQLHMSRSDLSFDYDRGMSPTVTSLSSYSGSGANLTIYGSNFGSKIGDITVMLGSGFCHLISVSDNQIECDLGANKAGQSSLIVHRVGYGSSNNNVSYTFNLLVASVSHTEGTVGGGLLIDIIGSGFSNVTEIEICEKNCLLVYVNNTFLKCSVPESDDQTSDKNCDLKIKENGQEVVKSFRYRLDVSPRLTSVSPSRGGTGGGTLITIDGTGFPIDQTMVRVEILGAVCAIETVAPTQITCRTDSYHKSSVKTLVNVYLNEKGLAINDGSVQFEYIDLWSSKFTWGGLNPPGEGELAVISKGQHIYFDAASTPKLKGIIIQEGSLIFDDNQDVSLDVEYVLILNGGKFQVGTEDMPFQHNAVITMHGHVKSIELPIFGAKVLGLREGTLDLHGRPVGVTWTHLEATSFKGSNEITVKEPLSWPVGSEIVIAPTGNKRSVGDHDKRRIIGKSNADQTLILNQPLDHDHLSEIRTVGSGSNTAGLHIRAEVGLLTRNVVFRGHNDDSWNRLYSAEACPKEPEVLAQGNQLESVIMTCFLGRYGPELGSDQFGGTILVAVGENAPKDKEIAIVRLSNVELFHVGQSFRLGRYPVHFHLNGNMPSSYVKECAIHESFNRAVNVHKTNYVTIERNFIFDIRGGAFFLEAGNEIGNVFRQNLAIFVTHASSLMNEDITPAAFWATNPNNTYEGNAVAGCSHFGFWYRISGCARKAPLGGFTNNTVHSCGRYGLWIFPGYNPTLSGSCSDSNPGLASFNDFTSYSCDKACEYVHANNIQLKRFKIWDHHTFGIETLKIDWIRKQNLYDETNGPLVADSILVGNSQNNAKNSAPGLVIAQDRGHLISNIRFFNFPGKNPAIQSTDFFSVMPCPLDCGGYTTEFQKLRFDNVRYRANWDWNWQHILLDRDGTLTEHTASTKVYAVAKSAFTNNDERCIDDGLFANGITCVSENNWIRFAFKWDTPFSEVVKFSNVKNETVQTVAQMVRLTYGGGMMVALESNKAYRSFVPNEIPSNMSYLGAWFGVQPGEYLIFKHPLRQKPDRVKFNGAVMFEALEPLTPSNDYGDWYWDNITSEVSYIIINKGSHWTDYIGVSVSIYKCFFVDCVVPTIPNNLPITRSEKPDEILLWSNKSTWKEIAEPGYGGYYGNNQFGPPREFDNVKIPTGKYILIDTDLPKLNSLEVEGYLELSPNMSHKLEVQNLIIRGGQLIIGWEDEPILTDVEIKLNAYSETDTQRRSKRSQTFSDPLEPAQLQAYGGLDIHGKYRNVTWTQLGESALATATQIKLTEPVDWQVGEIILISSTLNIGEDEEMIIDDVSSDMMTLKLTQPLEYDHIVDTESFGDGTGYEIAARVGLLSRNVKIIGDSVEGGNLLVGETLTYYYKGVFMPRAYKGFGRISNVEFINMGKKYFFNLGVAGTNAAVKFFNLKDDNRTSYLIDSSIRHGKSAVVVHDSKNILIKGNILYDINDFGIWAYGGNTSVIRNMVVKFKGIIMPILTGAIQFPRNIFTIEDNFISSVSTFGGYWFDAEDCDSPSTLKNNTVYASNFGVTVLREEKDSSCAKIRNFIVAHCNFGIYYHAPMSFIGDSNILVGNSKAIFSYITGPAPISHIFSNQYSEISKSLIVANPRSFNCEPAEKIGVLWPIMAEIPLNEPLVTMLGNALISGRVSVINVTFANFNSSCNPKAFVVTNNPANEDNHLPLFFENVSLQNVTNSSKVFYHFASRRKINPTDCVDMHCDGLKKSLITDIDGSLLGAPGTVIPKSEYGWGSNQLGLGDFRIPKEALADNNGHLIDPFLIYDHPGLVRNETLCDYSTEWQAYECHEIDHKILIIESMDADTLRRRLSPVAVLSDNRYIDLINGPEDYGWCLGYTCQTRLSTFMSVIAANHSFDIYLTSTPPETLRFKILHADQMFKVRLSMYYFTSMRIDLYLNDKYIMPSNAFYENGHMELQEYNATNLHEYKPNIISPSGMNLFHKPDRKIYFAMDGTSSIKLKIAPVLFVRFGVPAVTPEQFFSKNTVVGNFAYLLEIEPSKIRRVEIIRGSKRKRSVDDQVSYIVLTIEDDPINDLNDITAVNASKTAMNKLDAKVSNMFMTGQLQDKALQDLNLTISVLSVQKPLELDVKSVSKEPRIKVITEADDCNAQVPCLIQPKLMIVDENDNLIENIGNSEFPWTVKATITSYNNVSLILETEANVVNGYVNFTKLGVSDLDDNFMISFAFKMPEGIDHSKFNESKVALNPKKSSSPTLACLQTNEEISVSEGTNFDVEVGIIDKNSRLMIPDISWNNLSWTSSIELHSLGYYAAPGSLSVVNSSAELDASSGTAVFSNLAISSKGMYLLTFRVASTNGKYGFKCFSKAITVTSESDIPVTFSTSDEPNYIIKFEGNYSSIEPDEVKANVYNFFSSYVGIGGIQTYEGSVYISFYSSSNSTSLITTLIASGLTVHENLSFSYASIDGAIFSCNSCVLVSIQGNSDQTATTTTTTKSALNAGLTAGAIAGAIVGSLFGLIFILIAALGYREFKKIKVKNTRVGTSMFRTTEFTKDDVIERSSKEEDRKINEENRMSNKSKLSVHDKKEQIKTEKSLESTSKEFWQPNLNY